MGLPNIPFGRECRLSAFASSNEGAGGYVFVLYFFSSISPHGEVAEIIYAIDRQGARSINRPYVRTTNQKYYVSYYTPYILYIYITYIRYLNDHFYQTICNY